MRSDKINAKILKARYINIQPEFQRQFEAWDDKLITRLIESILLNRAMNPIWSILNPDKDSEDILDGMHRLTTALSFVNGDFKLKGKYFMELDNNKYDGKSFDELEPDDIACIENYNFDFNQLPSIYSTDANKRRDMYEILNRSSRTLNEYEFNKVLYKPFYDMILRLKKNL